MTSPLNRVTESQVSGTLLSAEENRVKRPFAGAREHLDGSSCHMAWSVDLVQDPWSFLAGVGCSTQPHCYPCFCPGVPKGYLWRGNIRASLPLSHVIRWLKVSTKRYSCRPASIQHFSIFTISATRLMRTSWTSSALPENKRFMYSLQNLRNDLIQPGIAHPDNERGVAQRHQEHSFISSSQPSSFLRLLCLRFTFIGMLWARIHRLPF